MTHHDLKIQQQWFDRLADGSKTAEVREHDRDYQIGDTITFHCEVRDNPLTFTATRIGHIDAVISHVLPASVFPDGIKPGYSVLSLVSIGKAEYTEPNEMRR